MFRSDLLTVAFSIREINKAFDAMIFIIRLQITKLCNKLWLVMKFIVHFAIGLFLRDPEGICHACPHHTVGC